MSMKRIKTFSLAMALAAGTTAACFGQNPQFPSQAAPDQSSSLDQSQQNPANGSQAASPGWHRFGEQQGPADNTQQQPAPQQPQNQQQSAQRQYAPPSSLTLPAGSWITVRMNQLLSTDHNQTGDAFTATLAEPVIAQGLVVARRGQTVGGRVTDALKAGHVKGTSQMGVELTELTLADGQQIPLKTQFVERRGDTSVGRDAAAVGTTTGLGAAIGAAAGGGVGAGIGAGAGAVVSLAGVLVTRGRPTVIYPETVLTFRLEQPLTITSQAMAAFQPPSAQDYSNNNGRPAMRTNAQPRPYGAAPYPAYPAYPYAAPYYGYSYPYAYAPGVYFGPTFFYGRGFYGRRW